MKHTTMMRKKTAVEFNENDLIFNSSDYGQILFPSEENIQETNMKRLMRQKIHEMKSKYEKKSNKILHFVLNIQFN